MVRNIRNKAGEPSKVGVVKRSAGRPKKADSLAGKITNKEVIKPVKIKKTPVKVEKVNVVKTTKAVKSTKNSVVKKEKKVVSKQPKKAVNIAVKNISDKKVGKKTTMSERLSSIKKSSKKETPRIDIDMEIASNSDLIETMESPLATTEETITLFSRGKKAKGVMITEKTEDEKKIIMWTGVVFFMVLIIAIWAYNIKTVIDVTASNVSQSSSIDATNDMKKNLQDLQANLRQAKNEEQVNRDNLFRPATDETKAAPTDATSTLPATIVPGVAGASTSTAVETMASSTTASSSTEPIR